MEDNELKEYKKAQKFYFNEEGKLVVESKKGVWVDGELFVKMYGNFVCNAKTMGIIIQHLKGIPVEIGVEEKVRHTIDTVVDDILNIHEHTIEHYCIIGANKERIKEYENELAVKHFTTKEIEETRERAIGWKDLSVKMTNQFNKLETSVKQFNALPWYKRVFKKISIQ